VHYVTRGDNAGAKAGNINHVLTKSSGDVICVVDADFVPSAAFIDEMLRYFTDPEVALFQAPQEFYNTNSFQHAGPEGSDWNEQSSSYRVIQPGKNRTPCSGVARPQCCAGRRWNP
jgi:cellulose synthase (UDP-forming)